MSVLSTDSLVLKKSFKRTNFSHDSLIAAFGIADEQTKQSSDNHKLAICNLTQMVLKQSFVPTKNVTEIWGNSFTKASIQVYGAPESKIAKILLSQLLYELDNPNNNSNSTKYYSKELKTLINDLKISDIESKNTDIINNYSLQSEITGKYLNKNYKKIFKFFNKYSDDISPHELKNLFSKCLKELAKKDRRWQDWIINIQNDSDLISVDPAERIVNIGENRRPLTRLEAKGLFGHEFLVHAQRAINGFELSKDLGVGLPGYLDSEEGLGSWFEYAITAQVPQKIIDRYLDVSLALGTMGNKKVTRTQMIKFCLLREKFRAYNGGIEPDMQQIMAKISAHTNRIYRCTSGNDFSGVFAKDIAYFKGFISIAKYIKRQITAGISIESIIDFILAGKFDPNNAKNVAYVVALKE